MVHSILDTACERTRVKLTSVATKNRGSTTVDTVDYKSFVELIHFSNIYDTTNDQHLTK